MENLRLNQIKEMLKAEPEDEFLNYALAIEFEKNGEINEAIKQLQGMIAKNENYLAAYYKLGKLFEEASQIDEAKTAYTKGQEIAKQQNNKKAFGELAEALWMLED